MEAAERREPVRQHEIDRYYMRIALSQAMRGELATPNPRVGCVIVNSSGIVATAYHAQCGQDHAEAAALKKAKDRARGSTAYVTLEPCSHYGRTPPCAPRLVEAGVKRVVMGTGDPDPRVRGRGVDILLKGGVEVTEGILEDECRWINRGFIRRQKAKRPWVILKSAVTLDGKIALFSGESRWITGYTARKMAHLLRGSTDAVMVGAGTCRTDDPKLTLREAEGRESLKIVIDPSLSIPFNASIYLEGRGIIIASAGKSKMISGTDGASNFRIEEIKPEPGGHLAPEDILATLGSLGINSVLVEGGAKVTSDLLKKGLVDEVSLFVSPSIVGKGLSFTEYLETAFMKEKIRLKNVRISSVGKDFLIEGIPECSLDL